MVKPASLDSPTALSMASFLRPPKAIAPPKPSMSPPPPAKRNSPSPCARNPEPASNMENIFMSQIQTQFLGVELYFENLERAKKFYLETLNLMLSEAQPQTRRTFSAPPAISLRTLQIEAINFRRPPWLLPRFPLGC